MYIIADLSGFSNKFPRKSIVTLNLQNHLDAGDSSSYTGSGTTWSDLTTNGYDFTLTTPTFNGTAGNLSSNEYFKFGGNDIIPETNADSGSILRTIGQQGQAFTIEMYWYFVNTTRFSLHTNVFAGGESGFRYHWSSVTAQRIFNDFFPTGPTGESNTTIGLNAWHQVVTAGKPDGTTTGTFYVDGAANGTWTANNSGYTTGDSTRQAQISGRPVDSALRAPNLTRLAIVRVYDRILTASEVSQNFEATRGRFGI